MSESFKASPAWVLRMAWRDMRAAKRKLVLFALAVVSGIAALVAINSFRANLAEEMDRQSRALLGADVSYDSRQPFSAKAESLIAQVPAQDAARETRFATMAYFPTNDGARLVEVRAMEGGYPWYGKLDTKPSRLSVAGSDQPVALVEDTLMLQFGLKAGDPIKLGDMTFTILGELLRAPGDGAFSGTFAPRALIPMAFLEQTGLAQFGSRLRHYRYQKFADGDAARADAALERIRNQLDVEFIDVDDVEDQRRQIGERLDSMTSFLSMIGFVALLLGGVAIAGAVQVYLKAKADAVATLRCLGASARQAMAIYCIQISLVGLLGSVAGAVLGVTIQKAIPQVVAPLLPFDLPVETSWPSILTSLAFGWVFSSLFALLPLLPLRRVSPLRALRASVEADGGGWRDGATLATVAAIVALSAAFAWIQTSNAWVAAYFLGGIATALAVLTGLAVLLRAALRRLSPGSLPFVWRQGLANLYRPNNRTTLLVVTLGMGAFLVYTIYVSEQSLLRQGDMADRSGLPNVILFDIQPDQLEGVNAIVADMGLEPRVAEPIVTMRISQINGRSPKQLQDDPAAPIERWALWHEYRSTYRDRIREDETLAEGSFTAEASLESGEPVPISIEARMVEALGLKLGDEVVWDVQGLPIPSRVTSIRKVDWRQMKPNFFVVFPAGVLEEAPTFYITATRAPDAETLAGFQSEVVRRFSNVSVVNLTMVLESLGEIFDKISFIIRFMATFTIATGLVALVSSVLTSRYQRMRESALLRAIGASAKQIRGIMAVEYLLVGALAGLAGVGLSLGAAWAVTRFVLRVELSVPLGATAAMAALVGALTLATGLLNSLGVASRSPMDSIRSE